MSVYLDHITRHSPQGGRAIVDDVSLSVKDGSFTALVGPSGAGKTSLLRIIAGLDPHQRGQVSIDGRRVDTLGARERNIGFVFQHYALFAHMTVAANIGFGLAIRPRHSRPGRAAIRRRVEELLELMQLPAMGARYPHELSGGQRQRVALARALATGPRVLLLDEPFGALDPLVRRQIRGWLHNLHERLGLTTILVTHDRQEAAELADTVVIMNRGRVVQSGTPQELEDNPADPFVMDFSGETIRIAGLVTNGRFVPDMSDIIPVPVALSNGRAEILIRPADIRLLPQQGNAIAQFYQRRGLVASYKVTSASFDGMLVEMPADPGDVSASIITHCAIDISAGRFVRDNAWVIPGYGLIGPVVSDEVQFLYS
ncbi:sulfate/molybdate ABC transporter ATP-binding protein [Komagataeibacter sp. NFXK3]